PETSALIPGVPHPGPSLGRPPRPPGRRSSITTSKNTKYCSAFLTQPRETVREFVFGGPDRRRSGDLSIFSRTLYQLSYRTLEAKTRPGGPGFFCSATPTGLEPAASAVTGRRSNQLSYGANLTVIILQPKYFVVCTWYP